jgi:predicted GNAT superfamily acetyltransferase
MEKIKIRAFASHSDFEKCIEIQRAAQKHEDISLTPISHYRIAAATGGILLGAFLNKEMVGFVYSFPAVVGKKVCQHSHILAVCPQYHGYGIGKELKWAQRDWALEEGYDLITWTADPLQVRNSNLNFHALGALSRVYLPDFYGFIASLALAPNVPTDRFWVEWPINENRVKMRREKKFAIYDKAKIVRALEQKASKKQPASPGRPIFSLSQKSILVEIPKDIKRFSGMPEAISRWQKAIRRVLEHYFEQGYMVDDFVFEGRCFYVLKRGKKLSWPASFRRPSCSRS